MWSLFCNLVLNVLSSFAIISLKKRRVVALLYLYFYCHNVCVCQCLFLAVPWVGLRSLVVAFPDHTHSFCMFLYVYVYLFCLDVN